MKRKEYFQHTDNFLTEYRQRSEFFQRAALVSARLLEERLVEVGIRSIVTSRAKSLRSLESKLRQRAPKKKYTCEGDIFKDIVDLAGIRVALYFPGDQPQVDSIIKDLFIVQGEPKKFPEKSRQSEFRNRFSGYSATHYRVHAIETNLGKDEKHLADARIEIQVASVLMHAWAEVSHDLVYKPQQGDLSEDEYAILDELNGMVLAGEIALELLQKAGKVRVATGGHSFLNHYDLAAHLISTFESTFSNPVAETDLSRMDLLYDLLTELNLASSDKLKRYIPTSGPDLERRPLADRIIDNLLAEDSQRYAIYERLREDYLRTSNDPSTPVREIKADTRSGIEAFVQQWSALEQVTGEVAKRLSVSRNFLSSAFLNKLGIVDETLLRDFDRVRRMRNELVHGYSVPTAGDLQNAGDKLQEIIKELDSDKNKT